MFSEVRRPLSFRVIFLFLLLLVLSTLPAASAQNVDIYGDEPVGPRNVSAVFPFNFDNVASLLPPSLLSAETPIAVRYALLGVVALYDIKAPCEERALNFWGEREEVPAAFCSDLEKQAELNLYALLRSIELEFREPARLFGDVMRRNGFDPRDRSTDKATAVGFGNAVGIRTARWFARDGWNSLGDLTRRNYRQPFEDFSGYRPVNSANKLRFPLRWQPLIQGNGLGRFNAQRHVVPFLGGVRPLVLTRGEVRRRRAPQPYRNMQSRRLSRADRRTLLGLIRELFEVSAELTPEQRFFARFWENKFVSVGLFGVIYPPLVGLEGFGATRWALGEMLAQHDAMVVAWKEKRRIDAIRPVSAVRALVRGRRVRAYVGRPRNVSVVLAEEWEPLIPVQPHSEYPSASAMLCSASFEHGQLLAEEAVRNNPRLARPPPVNVEFATLPPGSLPFDTEGLTSFSFDSLADAARSCGVSRLWAGVHFRPSVPAGLALGKGIGRRAYEHVRDLVNGRVPEVCARCTWSN